MKPHETKKQTRVKKKGKTKGDKKNQIKKGEKIIKR
jgi:hypothetical protein